MHDIKGKAFFQCPRSMLDDKSTRMQDVHCDYHNDCGHLTKNCIALRRHFEDLVKEGHLQEYLKEDRRPKGNGGARQANPRVEERATLGDTINTIHGVISRSQASRNTMLFEVSKVMMVEKSTFTDPEGNPITLEKVAFLRRLGYAENSEEMTKTLKKIRGRGDQLQERFNCLVEAGLDENTVASIIKQAPLVLNQHKNLIEKKIDSLKNCLGCPVEAIAGYPVFLCYGLERIISKFRMYAWLREKDTVKQSLKLSNLLACSDPRFVKYLVEVHPEGPAMWESLKKSPPAS